MTRALLAAWRGPVASLRVAATLALALALGPRAVAAQTDRPAVAGSMADAASACARVGVDDRVRSYAPAFRSAFAKAFAEDGRPPDEATLRTGTVRCMDRRLYGCIIGANQPCFKMNIARDNAGADGFCRDNPGASNVPLAASGHDSIYDYRCLGRRAAISRTAYKVDARGFAVGLWRPLD